MIPLAPSDADERGPAELGGEQAHRLGDVRDVLGGEVAQLGEGGAAAAGGLSGRSCACTQLEASSVQGGDDLIVVRDHDNACALVAELCQQANELRPGA